MNINAIGLTFNGKARTYGYNNQRHNDYRQGGGFDKAKYSNSRAQLNAPHQKTYSVHDTYYKSAPKTAKNPNGTNAHVVTAVDTPAPELTKDAIPGISPSIGGTASVAPAKPKTPTKIAALLTAAAVTLTSAMPNSNAKQISASTGTILKPAGVYEEIETDEDKYPPYIDETPEPPVGDEPANPPVDDEPVNPPLEDEPVIPPDEGGNNYPVIPEPSDGNDPVDPSDKEPEGGIENDELPEDVVVTPQEPDPVDPDDNTGSDLENPNGGKTEGGESSNPSNPSIPPIIRDEEDEF